MRVDGGGAGVKKGAIETKTDTAARRGRKRGRGRKMEVLLLLLLALEEAKIVEAEQAKRRVEAESERGKVSIQLCNTSRSCANVDNNIREHNISQNICRIDFCWNVLFQNLRQNQTISEYGKVNRLKNNYLN